MPQAMAGTEVYVHTLATLQKKTGHSVAVVTSHIDYYRPGQINEHYIYDDIDVYQFLETADPTNRQIHYGNKKPEGLNNFNKLIYQLKPDVIHFHELNRSIGITIEHVKVAKQTGAKIFLTTHLSSYTCSTNILVYNNALCDGMIKDFRCSECCYKTLFKIPSLLAKPLTYLSLIADKAGITEKIADGKIKTLLTVPSNIRRTRGELQEIVENVDQLVSCSRWYKKILIENGVPENKLTVLPTSLASSVKRKIDPKNNETGLPVKMVFIGRIQPTKGIHLIIKALRSFSSNQIQIDIYGRHEETAYYQQCVNDSNETIQWKGEIKREEVVGCLAQYDIFCLASTFSEMSPLVIQEAFAAGIPVLASKVYGNMEQIQDNHNGMLFEFDSYISLEEKIKTLIKNPSLIKQLKSNIISPISFEIISNEYLRLYERT